MKIRTSEIPLKPTALYNFKRITDSGRAFIGSLVEILEQEIINGRASRRSVDRYGTCVPYEFNLGGLAKNPSACTRH